MMNYRVFYLMMIAAACTVMTVHAQYENVWAFGNHAGLNFNDGEPIPIYTSIYGGNCEANASICDVNGQLLFYTEGSFVWDKNGALMPNGENLIGMPNNNIGESITSSTTQ